MHGDAIYCHPGLAGGCCSGTSRQIHSDGGKAAKKTSTFSDFTIQQYGIVYDIRVGRWIVQQCSNVMTPPRKGNQPFNNETHGPGQPGGGLVSLLSPGALLGRAVVGATRPSSSGGKSKLRLAEQSMYYSRGKLSEPDRRPYRVTHPTASAMRQALNATQSSCFAPATPRARS